MPDVDYTVVFIERAPDGRPQQRTELLPGAPVDPAAAYRDAHRRWMSGSAAAVRYNLQVRPHAGAGSRDR